MVVLQDSREQAPLSFPKMQGVEVRVEALTVADYTALHRLKTGEEHLDSSVVERKGLGDLFTSFSHGYEAEKAKLLRARDLGLTYVLAIEGTISEVLQGYGYWSEGERQESRKSGLAQVRQLCSWERRYGVKIWYCESRRAMAVRIVEYFLAWERSESTGA